MKKETLEKNELSLKENRRDRYEFLPAVLEVLETPPAPFGRIIAITIATFFSLAILWASLGTVDVVAVSQGRTIPAGNVKIIQPLEIGVVRAIYVQDGDSVKQNDILLKLDSTESVADLDALHIELEQARIDLAIGYALLQPDPPSAFEHPNGSTFSSAEAAHNQVTEQYRQHTSSLKTIHQDIQRLKASQRSLDIERRKLSDTLPLVKDQLQTQQNLLKQRLTQKNVVQALRRELIETHAALETTLEAKKETKASIEANQSRIEEITATYRLNAIEKRGQALQRIALLQQSIRKEQQRLNYLELRAPVDGVVQQLSVHTIGAVVNTAEPLLVIVPKDTPLEIESLILNKDIGFVESGQIAEIKFEAFPFTRYGTLSGKLVSISNDAIINETLGPVYKAKVSLDSQEIIVDGRPINLSPGMNASIEVKTGKRRVIDFFLSPLLRYKDEAIRER